MGGSCVFLWRRACNLFLGVLVENVQWFNISQRLSGQIAHFPLSQAWEVINKAAQSP